MNQETRQCQNCHKEFVIDEWDFAFYEKIKVSEPTWCPECRMQRRLIWRQERTLYKRKCDLCNKDIITMYPNSTKFPVYCISCWLSDKWQATDYAKNYDFNRPFFEQFNELLKVVPKKSLEELQNENSPYTNYTWVSKNVYLSYSTIHSENILYSRSITKCKDCIQCGYLLDSELCYQCIDSDKCFNSKYLVRCSACLDSTFLFDCKNCQNCFFSANLRNKQYVINNQQYSKEEYQEKIKQLYSGNYSEILKIETDFNNFVKNKALHKFSHIIKSVNSSGNFISNSKNIFNSFDILNSENVKHSWRIIGMKDVMDVYGAGDCYAELLYEGVNIGYKDSLIRFSTNTYENIRNASCCDYCKSSSNIFGCVGLRKKEYCILNKQYTKQEYEELVPKIIAQMNEMPYLDKKGRVYKFGEFFPPELSPYAYNETLAQEYFPLSKKQVIEQGFEWKDEDARNIQLAINPETLPDNVRDVDDSIINKIISCAHKGECKEQCTKAFKIIPQELELYRKMNIPLPRICPNCRYYQIFNKRNLPKLYQRKCNKCGAEIQSTYAPDRPEIVYCEDCYNKEIL